MSSELDSSRQSIEEWRDKIEFYQEKLNELELTKELYSDQISVIEEYGEAINLNSVNKKGALNEPFKSVISNSKSLQIGLTKPTNSEFLINGLPLFGVSIESEVDKYYISVSGGRIYNPRVRGYSDLQETNKVFQFMGIPNQAIQFNGLQFKGGLGKVNESHMYIGWLGANSANLNVSENFSVFEIDNRIQYKWFKLDVIAATSSNVLENSEVQTSEESNENSSLIKKSAISAKTKVSIRKTKTILSGYGEYFGPEFFSPGIGYQRAGLTTYKIEAKQKIFRKTKVGAFYSQETDGMLLNQLTYNVFKRWGIEVNQQIGRHIELFGQFSPLIQQVVLNRKQDEISDVDFNELDSIVSQRDLTSSYLINTGGSWNRRFGEVELNVTVFYQYYIMEGESFKEQYDFISIGFSGRFSQKYSVSSSYSALANQTEEDSFAPRSTFDVSAGAILEKGPELKVNAMIVEEGGITNTGYGIDLIFGIGSSVTLTIN